MSNSRTNIHLKERQLATLKDKVLAEMERIKTKLSAETLMQINQSSGRDEVDSANDEIMNHAELRFARRETLYLKKLGKSLTQMNSGDEYGMCEDCGSPILFQRLIARPTSTMCIGCKEESEKDELQNFHGRKSKSLAKTVSLA